MERTSRDTLVEFVTIGVNSLNERMLLLEDRITALELALVPDQARRDKHTAKLRDGHAMQVPIEAWRQLQVQQSRELLHLAVLI